jgi:peroxiredoxin
MEVKMKLKVGKKAPDFTLPCHLGKDVTLSDLRGMTVVIAFFPLAWTPV